MTASAQHFEAAEKVVALIERFYLDLGEARYKNPCCFNPGGGKALEVLQEQTLNNLLRYREAVAAAAAEVVAFAREHPGWCADCGGYDSSHIHREKCLGENLDALCESCKCTIRSMQHESVCGTAGVGG